MQLVVTGGLNCIHLKVHNGITVQVCAKGLEVSFACRQWHCRCSTLGAQPAVSRGAKVLAAVSLGILLRALGALGCGAGACCCGASGAGRAYRGGSCNVFWVSEPFCSAHSVCSANSRAVFSICT